MIREEFKENVEKAWVLVDGVEEAAYDNFILLKSKKHHDLSKKDSKESFKIAHECLGKYFDKIKKYSDFKRVYLTTNNSNNLSNAEHFYFEATGMDPYVAKIEKRMEKILSITSYGSLYEWYQKQNEEARIKQG